MVLFLKYCYLVTFTKLCENVVLCTLTACPLPVFIILQGPAGPKTLFFELYGSQKGWLRVSRAFEEVFCKNSQLSNFDPFFDKSSKIKEIPWSEYIY